jgi:hypothetical protein
MTTTTIGTNIALATTTNNIAYTKSTDNTVISPYINAGAAQNLFLKFNYFTNSIIDITAARNPNYNKGIEFYTSFALPTVTTPGCGFTSLTGSDVTITACTVTSGSTFTQLRFRIGSLQNTANVNSLFQAAAGPGEIFFTGVTFDSSKLSTFSYLNEYVYDFYGRWLDNFASTNPSPTTLGSSFFFNSLVYQSNTLQNLYISPAFMSSANTGSSFPSLIRITGSLTPTEATNANSLYVFFNGLSVLNTKTPCFGTASVTCNYKTGDTDTTQTNNLPDYSSSKLIQIIFSVPLST